MHDENHNVNRPATHDAARRARSQTVTPAAAAPPAHQPRKYIRRGHSKLARRHTFVLQPNCSAQWQVSLTGIRLSKHYYFIYEEVIQMTHVRKEIAVLFCRLIPGAWTRLACDVVLMNNVAT